MKVKTSKGFTLAELLIVMAIITILAAVAIPTFSKQLETAREAADVEVLRSAYTEAYTQAIKDVAVDGKLDAESGKFAITGLKFTQAKAGFAYVDGSIGPVALSAITTPVQGHAKAEFTFTFTDGDLVLSAVTTGAAA